MADAEATYRQLLSLKPKDENPYLALGDFCRSIGQGDKALATYQQAFALNPESVASRDSMIGLYLDLGKLDKAEGLIKPMLEKNEQDLSGIFFRGRLLLARGDIESAVPREAGLMHAGRARLNPGSPCVFKGLDVRFPI
jgi:tetratricopeptide (TPR) repeat protein